MTITLRPHQQRVLDRLAAYDKGQVIVPTGGGKTICMIQDTINQQNNSQSGITTVVVAPRILLANQLCSEFLDLIDNAAVMHVHSGETEHFSSTKPALIANWHRQAYCNQLIFTTYNSLKRIQEADIEVNTIYFDEAHNSVKRNFFPATEYFRELYVVKIS